MNITDEINICQLYISGEKGCGIEGIALKYKVGKLKIKDVLKKHGIDFKTKGGQINNKKKYNIEELSKRFVTDDSNFEFVAKSKYDGTVYKDYLNTSGALTSFIKNVLSIETPSQFKRKIWAEENGMYWYEQYFDIIKIPINKVDRFIEKAKEIHKDENLDYSKIEYINNKIPVLIIDHDLKEDGSEYGEYWQSPSNHLKGQSHPLKKNNKISISKSFNDEEIIKRFKEIHNNENLDYSEVNYVNMHTKVKIIDHDLKEDGSEYGEYWQEPAVHLKGCGHPIKGKNKQILSMHSNTNEFIEKSKNIHNDKNFDYSNVNYINNRSKVTIICNKKTKNGIHGVFDVSPDNFLQGKGCPKCGNHFSYVEDEIIDYIGKFINVEKGNKKILNGKEIDILLPLNKIGIEYNGLRWHTEWFGGRDRNYHLNKTLECNEKGYGLIHIFEDEYVLHKDIVLNKLSHILGIQQDLPRIAGRKCIIKEINKKDADVFLDIYHIQGSSRSTIYLGSYYEEKLIAVMTFKKLLNDTNDYDLTRFASDYNYICQGVGGKLFKYFIKHYNPSSIISFADRRWTVDINDNVYTKLGFTLVDKLKPDYRYYNNKVDRYQRFHKFGFRKQIINKKYGLPLTMTETEMVKELGYDRIWDCGLIKYKYEINGK